MGAYIQIGTNYDHHNQSTPKSRRKPSVGVHGAGDGGRVGWGRLGRAGEPQTSEFDLPVLRRTHG